MNCGRLKFNFNKLLLKATSIVVIGAFLLNPVFIDLVWANPNFYLRVAARGEDPRLIEEKLSIAQRCSEILARFELNGEGREKEREKILAAVELYLNLREKGSDPSEAFKETKLALEEAPELNLPFEQIVRGYEGGLGIGRRRAHLQKIDYQIITMTNAGKSEREIAKALDTSIFTIFIHRRWIIARLQGKNLGIQKVSANVKQIKRDMEKGITELDEVAEAFSRITNQPKEQIEEALRTFWEKMKTFSIGITDITRQELVRSILVNYYPYININFNLSKIAELPPLVFLIHPNLLFDNPGLALAIENLKEQLGDKVIIVFPYDPANKVEEFCQKINQVTKGGTSLTGEEFMVVSEEAQPEEVLSQIGKKLEEKGLSEEFMKLKVIGPKNWVRPYREALSLKNLQLILCEIGEGNEFSPGDLAIIASLVDEGLLNEEVCQELVKKVEISPDRKIITVPLKKVEEKTKEVEYIEAFRKMFEKYK